MSVTCKSISNSLFVSNIKPSVVLFFFYSNSLIRRPLHCEYCSCLSTIIWSRSGFVWRDVIFPPNDLMPPSFLFLSTSQTSNFCVTKSTHFFKSLSYFSPLIWLSFAKPAISFTFVCKFFKELCEISPQLQSSNLSENTSPWSTAQLLALDSFAFVRSSSPYSLKQ